MNNTFLNILSNNFIVEYIYNNEGINTNDEPFLLMDNGYDGESLLLNQDNSQTKNARNTSVVKIDHFSSRYALLTPNKLGPVYNDFDSNLTNTNNLNLIFNTQENVKYDTIRIHLIQGFTFSENFKGIFLNAKVTARNNKTINLLSAIYRQGDNIVTNNPNPFLYSGRQYASYIEFKIPSFQYLKESYNTEYANSSTPNSDILSCKITDNLGFDFTSLLDIELGTFDKFSKIDNQIYTNIHQKETTSISSKDEFNDLGVSIEESSEGDFIEFYGTYNNQIFGNYINKLNNSNLGRFITINKLTVTEQIPNTNYQGDFIGNFNPDTNTPNLTDANYYNNYNNGDFWVSTNPGQLTDGVTTLQLTKGDFIIKNDNEPTIGFDIVSESDIVDYENLSDLLKTSEVDFIQNDNFNEIQQFRPILKFSGLAISYKIDYVLQIFNVITNSVVEKRGSFVGFNANKYGKKLIKINPGVINTFDVFNKKVINEIKNTTINTKANSIVDSDLYKKSVTSFKQISNIYSGSKNININENGEIVSSSGSDEKTKINPQGKSIIYLSPFDTFIQFNLYEERDDSVNSMDLDKIGELYLNFIDNKGDVMKINSITNKNISKSKGQVIFKVSSEIYNNISNTDNNVFYITSKSGKNSAETVIYNGKFRDVSERDDEENLQEQLENVKKELEDSKQNFDERVAERVKYLISLRDKENKSDEKVQKESLNVRSSSFNPYGPTGGFGLTGFIGLTNGN